MDASFLLAFFLFGLTTLGTLSTTLEARAFFVFGDSLADNGNNNYLATTARADFPPYGIDHPTHQPTGRFSNGLNIPDIISENLGAEPTLPYLSPELRGRKLLVGANFASAGVGILNDTGIQFANIIRMSGQLLYFEQYQQRVSSLIGQAQTKQLVNQALVLITLGGNDFVNNYFWRLYELGARRVLVTGTGPLGCAPANLAKRSLNGDCDPEMQTAADQFNALLVQTLNELNSQFGSDIFISADPFRTHMDFISDPEAYGFVTSKVACCGQGPYNGLGLCTVASNLCANRSLHAFWDAFHPTERANRIIVSQFMTGSAEYMNPMNLSTILAMDART
ncbi:GDSL esterase/lipase [Cocos nucifera]|uniref:GDSL esterase/lipase n=1 Tax=Cocos nucifera TaxID=13894 RepID=A0A8K0ILZ7_COCNU|nr:GDSL esterase/lipase [Cocos nucifera]